MDIGLSMVNIGEYIRSFWLDVNTDNVLVLDIPNTLTDFKRKTNTNVIDISDIEVGGMTFKCIHPKNADGSVHISMLDGNGKAVCRGSIIVMGFNRENGREILRDLNDDEVRTVLDNLSMMVVDPKDGRELYNAYALCNVRLLKE